MNTIHTATFHPSHRPNQRPRAVSTLLRASIRLLLLAGTLGGSAQAGDFFACNSGFTFQEKDNAARCFKEGREIATDPGACAPPSQKRVDHRDNVDACVAGPIAGDMVCLDPRTRIKIRKGVDTCVRSENDEILPPNRRVSR